MTLTLSNGPLSGDPADGNYRIDGPAHRLFFHAFPRRVRAVLGGETVLDTRDGSLLHETGILPQLYVPRADVRFGLLEATDHTTHCPFKGDASYWTVRAGERVAENAVWGYPEPNEAAPWLRDHVAVYWKAMDGWFDEDEQVYGHLRDPYHRVDVRDASVHVRVTLGGELIAESRRPKVLSETGLPNRFYLPAEDVVPGVLEPSAKHTHCPYKGDASYHTVSAGGRRVQDAAWFYPEPLEEATRVRDHVCFLGDGIETEIV
jgi:uncharacterized protein (DUF427 family)